MRSSWAVGRRSSTYRRTGGLDLIATDEKEAALAKAESLGGTRVMGPEKVMDQLEIGMFSDPEGHLIGVVK